MVKIFQDSIYGMGCFIDKTLGVIDDTGIIVACSDLDKIGQFVKVDFNEISIERTTIYNNKAMKMFGSDNTGYYAFFCEGDSEQSIEYVNLLTIAFSSMKNLEDDRTDRVKFIKNIVLDNILSGDVVIRAREMQFNIENNRIAMIIRVNNHMTLPCYEVVRTLFPDKNKDFIFHLDDRDTVLIKEIKEETTIDEIEKLAISIIDTLSEEYYAKVNIGIGTVVDNIKNISRSFKEAQIALDVGRVFDTEKEILSYESLGIGRLIYQLPTTLCEMFLKEIFKSGSIESLDSETLFTIQRFFENNLNVSETSRGLFVHRNTLVYRLEKIKKITGLDLREFDHAIVFKIALMVKKYLQSDSKNY